MVSPVIIDICCVIGRAFTLWSIDKVVLYTDFMWVASVAVFAVVSVVAAHSVSMVTVYAMGCLALGDICCGYFC